MKHLKTYESKHPIENLDIEYILMCFADIIDDYDANREVTLLSDEREILPGHSHKTYRHDRLRESWSIRLKLWDDGDVDVTSAVPGHTYKVGYDLYKLSQEAKRRSDILQDIDVASKRIKDKYNYNIFIDKEFTSFEGGWNKGWKEEFIIIRISWDKDRMANT